MATQLGAPNSGRIPASAFYKYNGPIYDAAVDGFFNFPYQQDVMQDAIFASDTSAAAKFLDTTLEDSFGATDAFSFGLSTTASELFNFTDAFQFTWNDVLNDVVALIETVQNGYVSTLQEPITFIDDAERFIVTETAINDVAQFVDESSDTRLKESDLTDSFICSELTQTSIAIPELVEAVTLSESLTNAMLLQKDFIEIVMTADAVENNVVFVNDVFDIGAFADEAKTNSTQKITLNITADFIDETIAALTLPVSTTDSAALTEDVATKLNIPIVLVEGGTFEEAAAATLYTQKSVFDNSIVNDGVITKLNIPLSTNDISAVVDSTTAKLKASIITVDGTVISDFSVSSFLTKLIDTLNISDLQKFSFAAVTATQNMRAYDILSIAPLIRLSDAFAVDSSTALKYIVRTLQLETVRIQDATQGKTTYAPVQSEIVKFAVNVLAGLGAKVLETLTLQDAITLVQGLRVLEKLGISSPANAAAINNLSVAEKLKLLDTISKFVSGDVAEFATLADAPLPKFFLTRLTTDNVAISDSIASKFVLRVTAGDNVNINDNNILNYIFRPNLIDGVKFAGALLSVNDTITTWVINTSNNAVSEYTNYQFNSFAEMQKTYVGASESGLYELFGPDDEGENIIARIRSGLAQINTSRFTAFKAAYLGVRGGGDWVLKVVTGDNKEYIYSVVAQDMQTTKVRMGKGLRTRYFSFELISTGQDFDLDNVEFIPMLANRRV